MILTIMFTILSAWYDERKRFTNHLPRFIFRAIIIFLISFFAEGNFTLNFLQNIAIFYLLFDYVLNILEKRKWNYIGGTAKSDLMWRKCGGWIPQLIFKLIFLTITILIQ